ncbi:MAG TPA: hypothetical protein VK989_20050 [Polyangia bacterium]|nr:hypothetical protein [Polyangia bacterium]
MKRHAAIRVSTLLLWAVAGCGKSSGGSRADAATEARADTTPARDAGVDRSDAVTGDADAAADVGATAFGIFSGLTALAMDGYADKVVGFAAGHAARSSGVVNPFVPLAGEDSSRAIAVSADGTIVAGTSMTGAASVAVLWTDPPGTGQALGFARAGDTVSAAVALSDDGSTVVATSGGPLTSLFAMSAFVWKDGDTTVIPPLPGDTGIEPVVMSADGSTVAGISWPNETGRVFVWTAAAGTIEVPLTLDAPTTPAVTALSADGSVLVGSIYSKPATGVSQRVFRWTRAMGTTYLTPTGAYATAGGVTADGKLIAGTIGQALFLSTAAGFVTTPFPPLVRNVVNLILDRGGSMLLGSSGDLLFDGNQLFAWTISSKGFTPLTLPYEPSIETAIPLGIAVDGRIFVATGGETAREFIRP